MQHLTAALTSFAATPRNLEAVDEGTVNLCIHGSNQDFTRWIEVSKQHDGTFDITCYSNAHSEQTDHRSTNTVDTLPTVDELEKLVDFPVSEITVDAWSRLLFQATASGVALNLTIQEVVNIGRLEGIT